MESLESLRVALVPHYLQIKFFHLFSVMIWGLSTAVAYTWYVRVAHMRWQRKPDDPEARMRRDWAFEQFDRGVVLEHVAFPIVLATGLLLFWLSGYRVLGPFNWLTLKFLIVVFIYIPMEVVDISLAHLGGNLVRVRKKGDMDHYERVLASHWLFLRITTPIVIIFVPLVIYLAVVKPF